MTSKTAMLSLLLTVLAAQPALADCDADLADAHQRIAAIKDRDKQIDERVKGHNISGACELVRLNLDDMTVARDNMDRCLTGFERRENVSMLEANIADINDVLTAHCSPAP